MPTKKTENTEKLTAVQVSEILRVSVQTVYRLAKRGMLQAHTRPYGMPRTWFDRSDVERLAASASST